MSMMKLAGEVWNVAVLESEGRNILEVSSMPVKSYFNSRNIRRSRRHFYTRADPFLLEWGGALYLFMEAKEIGGQGRIDGYISRDLRKFEFTGTILSGSTHYSYPHVFKFEDAVYLIPENQRVGKVDLYQFVDFPTKVQLIQTLLNGKYADTTPILHEGIWYLFTYSLRGLHIFYSQTLKGPFNEHPKSPVSRNIEMLRPGGPFIYLGGRILRPAQNCVGGYGRNLSLFEVIELSPSNYEEKLYAADIFDLSLSWRRIGAHHISTATIGGRTFYAVDGKQSDYIINRLISLAFRFL